MEIDIFGYVNKEEIRSEILLGIRYRAENMSEEDFKRVMSNAFYTTVSSIADEIVSEKGYEFDTRERIKEIIEDLSEWTVFRRPDAWEKANKNYLLLEKIVDEEKEKLRKRVIETFDSAFSEYEARQDIAQILSDHIYDIFSIEKKPNKDGNPS